MWIFQCIGLDNCHSKTESEPLSKFTIKLTAAPVRVVKTIWNRYSLTDLFDELIITPTQNKNIHLLNALYKLGVRDKNYNSETFTTYSKESRMRKLVNCPPCHKITAPDSMIRIIKNYSC